METRLLPRANMYPGAMTQFAGGPSSCFCHGGGLPLRVGKWGSNACFRVGSYSSSLKRSHLQLFAMSTMR